MKKLFKHRIFDTKEREVSSSARRLSLETLENRELLNADWGGFSSEILNEFSAESARYSVDLNGQVDYCSLIDMNADGVDELAVINYTSKTLDVYQSDESGAYSLVKSTNVAELDGAGYCGVAFGDVGGDGIADLVVVSQGYSQLSLTATVYNGSATFGFAKGSSKALDVSKFSDGLLFQSLDATLLKNASGGFDLAVQGSALSATGTTPRQTVLYSGLGTTNFGKTSQLLNISGSATTADPVLVGSATVDGKETLISIDKTTSATQKSNRVVLSAVDGSKTVNYTFDLASADGGNGGSFVAEWVVAENGTLIVGGTRGGVSGVLSMKIESLATETYQSVWTECDGLTVNAASCAAVGNMGGSQATPELFVANGTSFVVFNGSASENAGYVFEQNDVVVTTPNYRAVTVGDYDGDGQQEVLLVGDSNVWIANVAKDGTTGAPTSVYAFDRAVKDAVFGDFNGDGKIDIAVYYQADDANVAVGTNLQIFQQASGGAFVPVASYGVASQFVDFEVGRFTQTNADEIAVLYQTTSGVQYVNVLKLVVSSGSTTLTGARTHRVGSAGATTLTAGALYGSAVDDLVLVGSNNDSIIVLKNVGSTFAASTLSTNTSLSLSNYNPTAAQIGDVDGDGKADIVVLNSAAGANRGHVAYFLQTSTGFAAAKATAYVNGDSPRGLELADFNGDGRLDVLTIQTTTDGKSYLYTYLNNGSASVFASGVRLAETTVDADGAFVLASIDSNASVDVALAQGKKFGFYLNDSSDGPSTASGSVDFLCQSASSAAGATFEAATQTARTWLDEWSNFYVDVWASAGSDQSVSSATATLQYDPKYFVVSGVEAASGFTVSYSAQNGVVTATVTAKSGTTATGKTLLARIRFEPISVAGVVAGGVAIPTNGVLTSVSSGLSANISAQKVNGNAVASTSAPTDLALYPVNWDFNDDGKITALDFNPFMKYYGVETNAIPASDAAYRIFDFNGDGKITALDFNNFIGYYNVQANKTADSFYREEPTVSAASAVVASTASLGGDELVLANPSEAADANRAAKARAVDAALNDWNADDDDDVFGVDLSTL